MFARFLLVYLPAVEMLAVCPAADWLGGRPVDAAL